MKISKDKQVDIWLHHSEKMWRKAYATPFVGAVFIAGWYSMRTSGEDVLSILILVAGCFSMFFQWLIILRMSQFDGGMYSQLEGELPQFGAPLFGIKGKTLAQSIPLILLIMMFILLAMEIFEVGFAPKKTITQSQLELFNVH